MTESEKKLYEYTEEELKKKKRPELNVIARDISKREGGSYKYDFNKEGFRTKDELVGLVMGCQGKSNKKSDYVFLTKSELEQKGTKELRQIAINMSKRSPDTYTNGCSRWTKKVLIAYIVGCRGEPNRKQKGGGIKGKYNRSGWGFSFY